MANITYKDMHNRDYVGFILAAGLGTRLKPLTDNIPKPVLPFLSAFPIIYHAMWKFYDANILDVAINLHYLPQIIQQEVVKFPFPLKIKYSYEKEILGTGGALNPLRNWLSDVSVVIHNADIISDIDIKDLINVHQKENNIVTMVIVPQVFSDKTAIYIKGNTVVSIGEKLPKDKYDFVGTFCGIHVVSKDIWMYIPNKKEFISIIDIYKEILRQKKAITAYIHKGFWCDIGDIKTYFNSHLNCINALQKQNYQLLNKIGIYSLLPNFNFFIKHSNLQTLQLINIIHPTAKISAHAKLGPNVVICSECQIQDNSQLQNCIILPNTFIDSNQHLNFVIKYQDIIIPVTC